MRVSRVPVMGVLLLAMLAGPAGVAWAQNEDTVVDPVNGGLIYGDPDGRFTLPLVGDWRAVDSAGADASFELVDPPASLHVITLGTAPIEGASGAALAEIDIDAADLQLIEEGAGSDFPGWRTALFAGEDGFVVGVLTRQIDDSTVAIVGVGEPAAIQSAAPILTIQAFRDMPVTDYLARLETAPPTTVDALEDLDHVPFLSDGTELVGRLLLPEGDGPFPAIVGTHGSGPVSRWSDMAFHQPNTLVDAGFAVFYHDKRGAGDSEGVFVEVGPEWRVRQLAEDAIAAVRFVAGLDEIDAERVGIMGVSQAGWINPLAAALSDDIAFVVTVVGPTVTVEEEVYYSDLTGGPSVMRDMTEADWQELSAQLAAYDGPKGFDPRPALESMTVPGVWIYGELDGSIPFRESRAILEDIIAEQGKDFTILTYPDQGHYIGSSAYLDDVLEWLEGRFGSPEAG